MKRLLILLWAVAAFPAQAQAQDARSAEAFIRALYADPQLQDVLWDQSITDRIATPSLAALRRQDLAAERAAQDPSDLDFRPLCGCQDDSGMRLTGVTIHLKNPRRAMAEVTLAFIAEKTMLQIDLAAIGREWRLDDIRAPSARFPWDLRTILTRSISGHAAPVAR